MSLEQRDSQERYPTPAGSFANLSEAQYSEVAGRTRTYLQTIATHALGDRVGKLSLPEVEQVIDLVARMAPAGDIPGVILNGLLRLSDRRLPAATVKDDILSLFQGVRRNLDKAVYGTFFAGPAAIIWAYQGLLRLAGKDLADAFPEGTWQFYADYALREDTARHTHETTGFDTLLARHQICLSQADRMAAWVMAAQQTLHQYPELLKNEWRERVYCRALRAATGHSGQFRYIYREWERQRPFRRGHDAEPHESYAQYRRRKFDLFLERRIERLPATWQRDWVSIVRQAREEELKAYQQQLSLHAFLEPGVHGDSRTAIPPRALTLGLIYQDNYYLLPLYEPGSPDLCSPARIQQFIAGILAHKPSEEPASLRDLARTRRAQTGAVRAALSANNQAALARLQSAPILLNFDQRLPELTLAQIRQGERGVGDQPLTVFDTGRSFIFDQSHIFFDGIWGAGLAEIMTQEATSWAAYFHQTEPAPGAAHPEHLAFAWNPAEYQLLRRSSKVANEVTAEHEGVQLSAMLSLRQLFKRRSDLLQLTVNDLLVLYRAIHAASYQPHPDIIDQLEQLARSRTGATAAREALAAVRNEAGKNPAILIPIDATPLSPRDRVHPMCFEVPLQELDLLAMHERATQNLGLYGTAFGEPEYERFDRVQRHYLALLAGFGQLFSAARELATRGESASVGSIRLLAYMPTSWQRLLDRIPNQVGLLNDLIKGQEVFSNLGAAPRDSSIARFMTAKDDNENKALVWGVVTDAHGVMRITLRDFRPHVAALLAVGRADLAEFITKDYLNAYVMGLNDYIRDLRRITIASRDTYTPHDLPGGRAITA
ncbi:MAG: hypothetical protein H6651_21285 [Ardenticatenales bacterium]|nr:hypothetical protein [Ardenticatenales bacterium]